MLCGIVTSIKKPPGKSCDNETYIHIEAADMQLVLA